MAGVVNAIMAPELKVVYNGTSSPIPKGTALTFGTTVYDVADPVPSASVTAPVPGVVACGAHQEDFIGVAYETIAATSWGLMCVSGRCQALFPASGTGTQGDAVSSDANGAFATDNADEAFKAGILIDETFTSLAAAALKWIMVSTSCGALGRKST